MKKLSLAFGTGLASLALMAGVALPASAATQRINCSADDRSRTVCSNMLRNNSRNHSVTLGDGSAIIRSNVVQLQSTSSSSTQSNTGTAIGIGTGGDGTARSSGRDSGDSVGIGGNGTGLAGNLQTNTSTTSATGVQVGGVWFQ